MQRIESAKIDANRPHNVFDTRDLLILTTFHTTNLWLLVVLALGRIAAAKMYANCFKTLLSYDIS